MRQRWFVWTCSCLIVKKLASSGAKMVIISNSSRRSSATMDKLKSLGFDPSLFVGAITSGELTHQNLERLTTKPCILWTISILYEDWHVVSMTLWLVCIGITTNCLISATIHIVTSPGCCHVKGEMMLGSLHWENLVFIWLGVLVVPYLLRYSHC